MKYILILLFFLVVPETKADMAFGYSVRTGQGSFCTSREAAQLGHGNNTIACAFEMCRKKNIIGGCSRYSHFDDAGGRVSTHIAFFRSGRKGSYTYYFSFNKFGTKWQNSGRVVDGFYSLAKNRCERDGLSNCEFFTEFYWDASRQKGYKTYSSWSKEEEIP